MKEPLINLQDVCFHYDQALIIDHVNLNIYPNDFLAIIGPNGGGKTTLLKLLLGILKPSSGTINYNFKLNNHQNLFGYVPQHSTNDMNYPLQVLDVILMGKIKKRGFFSSYTYEDRKESFNCLSMLSIEHLAKKHISDLSGGELSRVLIARALASSPKVLILDEPTASIDLNTRSDIDRILTDINKEIPIVIVTHDISTLGSSIKQIACVNKQLHYHPNNRLDAETFSQFFKCPVDFLKHKEPAN